MAQFAVAHGYGLLAARPTDNNANTVGRIFYATDTDTFYRDNGTGWDAEPSTPADGSITTAKVADDAITLAKLQNIATDRLLGRSTAGTGDVEEIACTAAGRALFDDADAAAQRTTLGLGTAAIRNVPASGNAASAEVVLGSDTRLGAGGSGLHTAIVVVAEEQPSGTSGGTFTAGAWRTRAINVERADTGNHASVASSQVTLAAGTYDVTGFAQAVGTNRHQARLQNITAGTTLLSGTSEINTGSTTDGNNSVLLGPITLAVSSVLELQHQCQTTTATYGFGLASGTSFTVGVETYALLEFRKRA